MGYYVVHAMDASGTEHARTANRAAHRARLRDHEYPLTVHIGGPMLDGDDQMCGTMLVVEAGSRAVVETFLAGDPYTQAGVYDIVTIHPYLWGLGQPEATHG